jgi:hypothetical protein
MIRLIINVAKRAIMRILFSNTDLKRLIPTPIIKNGNKYKAPL